MKPEVMYVSQNPDFSEVLIFYALDAISFRNNDKRKKYGRLIKLALKRIRCENWPYITPLMIAIGICGPVKKYGRRDLDNMAKVILDAGNKIIYSDDRLVEILLVQKQIWEQELHGFMLGTRALQPNEPDKYTPRLIQFSHDPSEAPTNTSAPVIFQYYEENGRFRIEHVQSAQKASNTDAAVSQSGNAVRKTAGPKK